MVLGSRKSAAGFVPLNMSHMCRDGLGVLKEGAEVGKSMEEQGPPAPPGGGRGGSFQMLSADATSA